MKQTHFLATFLLVCLTLSVSTSYGEPRKFIIKNRDEMDAYCAYAYPLKNKDRLNKTGGIEYHIQGWVRVLSGQALTIPYTSQYPDLYLCIIISNDRRWTNNTNPIDFNLPKDLTEDSFKIVYEIKGGKLGDVPLHTSIGDMDSEPQAFYHVTPKEKGNSVGITIPGPVDIKGENILSPRPVDTPEPKTNFDGVYDTRGFERQGQDYALLFATNTYQHWDDLITPIDDAEAIGEELRNYGFKVDIRKNVKTREEILTILLTEYAQENKDYQPGDQLFVYFAGHGDFGKRSKDGYIAASNSKLPADDPAYTTYLSHARLKQDLDRLECERIMLVLDVCQGGVFDEKTALVGEKIASAPVRTRGFAPQLLLKDTLKVKTRWFLSSGGKEEVFDGTDNSPFTLSLLTVLRDGAGKDGVLTIAEIERQLLRNFKAELAKLEKLYQMELKQEPLSGPFHKHKTSDKAFVFIKSQK